MQAVRRNLSLNPPLPLQSHVGRPPRTPGLHLTDVLSFLEQRLDAALGRGRRPVRDRDAWEHAAAVGFMWEDWVLARSPCDLIQFETEMDGVLLSPDGLDTASGTLWECKFTWKSIARSPPDGNWRWMAQVMAYCLALRAQRALLAALYVCGDYRPPAPQMVFLDLEFTQRELLENWRMVQQGRAAMEKEGWNGV